MMHIADSLHYKLKQFIIVIIATTTAIGPLILMSPPALGGVEVATQYCS